MIDALQDGCIDWQKKSITRQGEPVALTNIEWKLLKALKAADGRPLSKESLLQDVWGYSAKSRSRTVQMTVRRLREKIEREPQNPAHIKNIYGKGYFYTGVEAVEAELKFDDGVVGRHPLLSQIQGELEEACLGYSIYGPAGVGKSRLLKAFTQSWRKGAAVYCDLTGLKTLAQAGIVIASALGLPVNASTAAKSVNWLGVSARLSASKDLLLVLDEVEAIRHQIPDLLDKLDVKSNGIRILVGSRSRLVDIPLERHLLAPLEPEAALALFTRRARERNVDPLARGDERDDILGLLNELDHLPLAIELAAARTPMFSSRELRARLNQRFELLRSAEFGASQGLGMAIQSSWDDLPPWAQEALAQLSICRGFDLPAAEAILVLRSEFQSSLQSEMDRPRTLEILDYLEGRGMLSVEGQPDGTSRWRLLDCVRDFAALRLDRPATRSVCQRHARHYAGLLDMSREQWVGTFDLTQYDRALVEFVNVELAMESALELEMPAAYPLSITFHHLLARAGESERSLAAFESILNGPFELSDLQILHIYAKAFICLRNLGRLDEAMDFIEESRQRVALEGMDCPELAHYWCEEAAINLESSRLDEAEILLKKVLSHCGGDGERFRMRSGALTNLANVNALRGQLDQAVEYYAQALEAPERIGPFLAGQSLAVWGGIELLRCRFDQAGRLLQQSLSYLRDCGEVRFYAIASSNLGALYLEIGELEKAHRLCRDAHEGLVKIDEYHHLAGVLLNLSIISQEMGDIEASAAYAAESRLCLERGSHRYESMVCSREAEIFLEQGRYESAMASLRQAKRAQPQHENPVAFGLILCKLGVSLAFLGDFEGGREVWEAAREALTSGMQKLHRVQFELWEICFRLQAVKERKDWIALNNEIVDRLETYAAPDPEREDGRSIFQISHEVRLAARLLKIGVKEKRASRTGNGVVGQVLRNGVVHRGVGQSP